MAQKIDVYDYIASKSPRESAQLLRDFGYKVVNQQPMAQSLRDLVDNEEEVAIVELMKIHPDRDYFENNNSAIKKLEKLKSKNSQLRTEYSNATGGTNLIPKIEMSSNQTNTIILASAIVIAFAILSKN